ncbi:unnamed protein product [Linum trigynum]|uniref:Uncharacterized protein n=1 Tax=Linum trigynum TaxID=586398 RepID=A0AAV2DN03_9ROSI
MVGGDDGDGGGKWQVQKKVRRWCIAAAVSFSMYASSSKDKGPFRIWLLSSLVDVSVQWIWSHSRTNLKADES